VGYDAESPATLGHFGLKLKQLIILLRKYCDLLPKAQNSQAFSLIDGTFRPLIG
jgi:hypothetical protein